MWTYYYQLEVLKTIVTFFVLFVVSMAGIWVSLYFLQIDKQMKDAQKGEWRTTTPNK